MNLILALLGKVPLKDWLLIAAVISLLGLGFYAKYVIDDRAKEKAENAALKEENSKMNDYLIEYAKDKNAIEKGKSSAISKIHSRPSADTVSRSISDAVGSLRPDPALLP